MAEFHFTLEPQPSLGRADITIGGNRIAERTDLTIVSIATPQGEEEGLASALLDEWGIAVPDPTRSSRAGEIRALRTAPDQILLIFPHANPDAEASARQKLNGRGYTIDQTDAWIILEVSGPNTLAALERLCPLDVASFSEGGAGRTVMEHMGALVLRLADNQFLLMSASSSARSFLHAVETSYRNVL
ncbi:sarcosine oxidase subunit gamma [Ovoidimarina sediminis]|uniref:sarcosine oxidase subunit gamma n=1 Tax=Ovoidimarina sediminis TaxID=3079856 RepID=UPI0029115E4F|nr:sarcosine oxidase subunit gamma [Rhodophyticola sp. MJ-SS7]MDU8942204.1 sarcosine oxidase subunit gamma [Rhodophyticola sp. MJ-SS7]